MKKITKLRNCPICGRSAHSFGLVSYLVSSEGDVYKWKAGCTCCEIYKEEFVPCKPFRRTKQKDVDATQKKVEEAWNNWGKEK